MGSTRPDLDDPVYRYAFKREAEHWWALDESEKALGILEARSSPIPRDNLRLWQTWGRRVADGLGAEDPWTFKSHIAIAHFTNECGEPRKARELLEAVLPTQQRVLGHEHEITLRTRSNIAGYMLNSGEPREALQVLTQLLPDLKRVFGESHVGTLTARTNLASCVAACGNTREAYQQLIALLPELEEALGPVHPSTLTARNNIASLTEKQRRALKRFKALLEDHNSAYGPNHPDTLRTRHNVAAWTGLCRDVREAQRLFDNLLPDLERVFGCDHDLPNNARKIMEILRSGGTYSAPTVSPTALPTCAFPR
jgi:hypothetical protein